MTYRMAPIFWNLLLAKVYISTYVSYFTFDRNINRQCYLTRFTSAAFYKLLLRFPLAMARESFRCTNGLPSDYTSEQEFILAFVSTLYKYAHSLDAVGDLHLVCSRTFETLDIWSWYVAIHYLYLLMFEFFRLFSDIVVPKRHVRRRIFVDDVRKHTI